MTERVDRARERMGRTIFASWDSADFEKLVRLMRKFADDINGDTPAEPEGGR